MFDSPTRNRRAERHEATKAEILEAAWELARTEGLAALSLRDVARRVGMQAPSLYSYFDSKHAIYDAMFAEGNLELRERVPGARPGEDALQAIRRRAKAYIEFATADPARYQLLFQRMIPGFKPSDESYAIAVENLDRTRQAFVAAGISDPKALDMYTALMTGIASQQVSNDPGGNRWRRLTDDALDMFFEHVTKGRKGRK
jgi:AcrR family transcriptional regulator